MLDLNRECDIAIDAATARCGWHGETMDYGFPAEGIYYADHSDELPNHFGGPISP